MTKKVKTHLRFDRVIVQAKPAEGKGIILSSHHHKHYDIVEGTIVEVGPDVRHVRVGQKVFYDRSKSQDVSLIGKRHCEILREEDVCAKISIDTSGSKSK